MSEWRNLIRLCFLFIVMSDIMVTHDVTAVQVLRVQVSNTDGLMKESLCVFLKLKISEFILMPLKDIKLHFRLRVC